MVGYFNLQQKMYPVCILNKIIIYHYILDDDNFRNQGVALIILKGL